MERMWRRAAATYRTPSITSSPSNLELDTTISFTEQPTVGDKGAPWKSLPRCRHERALWECPRSGEEVRPVRPLTGAVASDTGRN
ncbi:hypothetical protein CDL15_Pgr001266 [Punica granatum]|uniref:Uncharacterized protein n=1 Tax=Punica granatum TaxID=22663 RepID=A0A218WMB1_PUNGR|nr:hypothetical protein CDL15_Pgr001266 [Punica granatum]